MNIRFSDHSIRVRINNAELDALQSGRALALTLALPRERVFRVNVRPSMLEQWQLDSDPTGLWLTVPNAALRELAESVPSRFGLEHQFVFPAGDYVEVVLEVDVKDR
jgi:hypothetical protein